MVVWQRLLTAAQRPITLFDLIVEMLAHAWFPHSDFKLSCGSQDKIPQQLDSLALVVEAPVVHFKDPDKTLPPLITLAANQGFLTDWPLHPVSLAESPSNQGSDGKLQVAARLVKLKELEVATPCDRPNLQLSSQRGTPYSVPLG